MTKDLSIRMFLNLLIGNDKDADLEESRLCAEIYAHSLLKQHKTEIYVDTFINLLLIVLSLTTLTIVV